MKIGWEIAALRRFCYVGEAGDQQFLQGVYLDGEKGEAYATNGAVAVVVPLEQKDPTFKAIVPAAFFGRFPDGIDWPVTLNLCDDKGEEVEAIFRVGGTLATKTGFDVSMRARTIQGKFPNVRAIIPKPAERPLRVTLNAEYLRGLFDLALRATLPYHPLAVEFEGEADVMKPTRLFFDLRDGRRVECAMAQIRMYDPFGKT